MPETTTPKDDWRTMRGRAGLRRAADPTADITDLLDRMTVANIVEKVERLVAEAPPLNDDQRAWLREALHAGIEQNRAAAGGSDDS